MEDLKKKAVTTQVIHAGDHKRAHKNALVTPIYQTSTFAYDSAEQGARVMKGEEPGYVYTRISNPTIDALEESLALLEDGHGAIATSSGMAAVSTVYMTFLEAGAHVVASRALYGTSRTVLENEFSRFGVEATFVNTSDIDAVRNAIRENTKLLYLETPANPTISLSDIKACSEIARQRGVILAVDNTFATPILQKPLALGADVVLHSVTKGINGHTDVVGGIIIAKSSEHYERLRKVMQSMGGNMDPHQAWLVHRGFKTMAVRVAYAQWGAIKVAKALEAHPKVKWVKYPGLESHPHHDLAKRQMSGYGTMISFEVKDGVEGGRRMINAVKIATLAVSLGGVETLIQHPASMTHVSVPEDKRVEAGITDGLIRLSVGCEDPDDLISDLSLALEEV